MKKLHLKLLATVMVTSSVLAAGDQSDQVAQEVFQAFRSMVLSLNKACQNFLSKNNRESMSKHVDYFKTIETQSIQILKKLRDTAHGKTNLLELITYAETMFKEFKRFIAVVEKFKHSGPNKLTPFVSELKKTIDVKTIFVDMTQKIEALYRKYQSIDKPFADALLQFVNSLRVIVQQWDKRDLGSLLNDICFRMSIKS